MYRPWAGLPGVAVPALVNLGLSLGVVGRVGILLGRLARKAKAALRVAAKARLRVAHWRTVLSRTVIAFESWLVSSGTP